jgi:hypothetical protein
MITTLNEFRKIFENTSNPVQQLITDEVNNNFKNFIAWTADDVVNGFDEGDLIIEEDEWQAILKNSASGTLSDDQINQGLCNQFAKYIQSKVPEVTLHGNPSQHVYVEYQGKYYDSENAIGVNSPDQLVSAEAEFFRNMYRKKKLG